MKPASSSEASRSITARSPSVRVRMRTLEGEAGRISHRTVCSHIPWKPAHCVQAAPCRRDRW